MKKLIKISRDIDNKINGVELSEDYLNNFESLRRDKQSNLFIK